MKFQDFKYSRPNLDEFIKDVTKILDNIGTDKDLETEINAINEYNKLNDTLQTQVTLASIRNSINTKDEFYEQEMNYFNEQIPALRQYSQIYIDKLLTSKNRKSLEERLGSLSFEQAELAKKTFSVEIIEDLQLENKLSMEYSKLTAGAEIHFNDQVYNLSQMSPFLQDLDRTVRKNAQLAVSKFFKDNLEQYDRIYDDMVKVRDKIAKKLGYENFVQLGYDRLGRTDYNKDDVKKYRDQIYNEIVPLVSELTKRKANRLNITEPKSYDLSLSFLSGNPTPKGDRSWQVDKARKMYNEMSKQTSEFFEFMLKHELLELDSKPGKSGGGYCTYLPDFNAPYIFANFNGTAHDVDVLTHEAGHAFQVYQSRDLAPDHRWPTMEAAEIHSMSMEFLAWPWINEFFLNDTEKYKFSHLAGAVSFLPYGVLVDEFQTYVYENPNVDAKTRRLEWRKLERKYLPFKDYGEDSFLEEEGGFWLRQGHIFGSPFYYIDYTLAQVVAFQYWIMSQDNYENAWKNYSDLCKLGGSKSFLGLLESANLKNPFLDGTVKEIVKPIEAYLNNVDDSKL